MLGVPVEQRVRHARTSISARPTSTTSTISAAPTACTAQADGPFRREVRDIAQPQDPQRARRHGAARARSRPSRTSPAPTACRTTISTPRPRSRAPPLPGFSTGQALAAMERLAAEVLPDGFAFEWTELAYQEKLAGNTGDLRVHRLGGVRLPVPGRAVRELAAAAGRDPDRADVPARRDHRRPVPRAGQQHPDPDRPGRAGRPRRQERDPDRRVRQAARGGGRGAAPRPRSTPPTPACARS